MSLLCINLESFMSCCPAGLGLSSLATSSWADQRPGDVAAKEAADAADVVPEARTQEGGPDWARLMQLKWCLATKTRVGRGLPWCNVEDTFYSPEQIRLQEDVQSVSGACPLLDGTAEPALQARLGWSKPPSVALLKKQINRLAAKASPCSLSAPPFTLPGKHRFESRVTQHHPALTQTGCHAGDGPSLGGDCGQGNVPRVLQPAPPL